MAEINTNADTVEVNINLALAGTVSPDNATNRTMVWTVADAGGIGAVINGSTFRAATAGTATVKAAVAGGLTASTPYEKKFTIRVTTAPAPVTTHTSSGLAQCALQPVSAMSAMMGGEVGQQVTLCWTGK